jgi:uncharacterized membrane protein
MARCVWKQRRSERGFVLIVTCIVLAILLGLAGVGIDIGRMYVIESELQAFSDAAALNAALQLDGTEGGLKRASQAASELATGPHAMKWDLGSQSITNIKSSFVKNDARVVVSAPAPLIFLRVLPAGAAGFANVTASSVARKTAAGARLIQ